MVWPVAGSKRNDPAYPPVPGWGIDKAGFLRDVLYIDLPFGQVSFHSEQRYTGPAEPVKASWDECKEAMASSPLAATLGADGRNPTAPGFARPLRAEGNKALDGQKGKAQNEVA